MHKFFQSVSACRHRNQKTHAQKSSNFEDRVVASGSIYFDRVFGVILSGKQ
jgi:hypothetical protein